MSDSDSPESEIRGKKGRYILNQRPFSLGSSSILWQARDGDGNIVCVKSFHRVYGISDQSMKEFVNELIARQTIEHPHILPILDYGYEDRSQETTNPFIVLPYCQGGNLRELMHGRDFISPQIFFPILEQIALAVDFAHTNGIIHGDIKPENILFNDKARHHAWLADFGIASFFPVSEEIITEKEPGAGSTAYLSPEQIGENRHSSSSDIYALAMVAYEALTGRLPFDVTAPPFKQMYAKVNGELVPPLMANGRLTKAISDGLLAGLNVDPLKRPQTGIELYELLQNTDLDPKKTNKQYREQKAKKFNRQDLLRFYRILCDRFSQDELRSLCFELGHIDYDELPGLSKNDKARELVSYLVRRDCVIDLVTVGERIRPDIHWLEDEESS